MRGGGLDRNLTLKKKGLRLEVPLICGESPDRNLTLKKKGLRQGGRSVTPANAVTGT